MWAKIYKRLTYVWNNLLGKHICREKFIVVPPQRLKQEFIENLIVMGDTYDYSVVIEDDLYGNSGETVFKPAKQIFQSNFMSKRKLEQISNQRLKINKSLPLIKRLNMQQNQ